MIHANDNHTGLRFLSVCSGIEAASVAWHPLGWRAVAFSEIEKFPSAVLKHHYPDVPNLGDFTKIDTKALGRVDILAGGTPCQAFSVAGLRQSLADARGNLSLEFVRLAHELAANNGLRNVVWENVVGVLSTKDNAFGCFLAGLVGADSAIEPPRRGKWARHGMVSGPKGRAAWAVKDGQFFGVAQRRSRVLVVADFGNGADPAAVLFEPESMFRDTPPSRKAGKGTAGAAEGGAGGRSLIGGIDYENNAHGPDEPTGPLLKGSPSGGGRPLPAIAYTPEIARCDATREGSSQDYETTTMVAVGVTGEIAHTLQAEGADASEDGTGRGTPIVACTHEVVGTLCAEDSPHGARGLTGLQTMLSGYIQPVAFAQNSRDEVRLQGGDGQIVGALAAQPGMKQTTYVATSAVRRLTPVECERLQGFPDNYTAIPWRGKPNSPDGPRYKALGNSWAVPKFVWLGKRIQQFMPANDNHQSSPADIKVSHA